MKIEKCVLYFDNRCSYRCVIQYLPSVSPFQKFSKQHFPETCQTHLRYIPRPSGVTRHTHLSRLENVPNPTGSLSLLKHKTYRRFKSLNPSVHDDATKFTLSFHIPRARYAATNVFFFFLLNLYFKCFLTFTSASRLVGD